ncbi:MULTISPECIES: LysE family transporter [Mammaliicoccus]|uniref:LysE family transporter n=1 Tax=Mammaliicoccus TaxID=2803850 RepID=UPI0010719F38|nr:MULTISPECIES: LysE family transporter [Mammaliicoccus]MBF0749959.1 LysE family transporter [Mammaliicoccus lentus]MBW0762955.1 LysE family transporter [Mammaliicoccus lentus]MCR1873217.1 LysE family transporter [Mammaliicoccus lentus]TFU57033.1 lysine transporter LysE [Mammaliicoccus lentus]WQK50469.1 LysE family transporter [Mammaliicoccus lentus]
MLVLSMTIYAVVSSFTPGPNNIMSLFYSKHNGMIGSLRFCIGVGLGFFLLLLISNFFSSFLYQVFPKVQLFMKIFGAVYLLYLAYKIATSKSTDENGFSEKYNNIKFGMALQFINPKGTIYALSVVAAFVTPNFEDPLLQFILLIYLALIGFLGTFSWSVFGSIFKKFIKQYELMFNLIMALLLVYTAISILYV